MIKLFITRHGQTESNKLGITSGWDEALLTDEGRKQAHRVGEALLGIPEGEYLAHMNQLREDANAYRPTNGESRNDVVVRRHCNQGDRITKCRFPLTNCKAYSIIVFVVLII